ITGVVAAKEEVRQSFKVGGLVAAIAVQEGDVVRKGQVLARLQLAEVDAAVASAQEAVRKAERDEARADQLLAQKAATRAQRDDAATALSVARAQLSAASFNRRHAVIVASADGRVHRRLAEVGELVAAGQPVLVVGSSQSGWVLRASVS